MTDPAGDLSIIVTTYNRAGSIRPLVALLEDQVSDGTEVVIVDDGSTDDTATVLASLAETRRWLRPISTPNGRLSNARNAGAKVAGGRWLLFLDDDDRPRPGWAAAFRDRMDHDDLAVISCGARYVDPDGTVQRTRPPQPMGPAFRNVSGRFLGGATAFRADVFAAAGGFRPEQPTSHMTELLLRLLPRLDDPAREVATIDRDLIDIVQAPAGARPRNNPARLLAGSTYLLEAHGDALRRDPPLYADYAGVAAVAAARAGDLSTARRWTARSVRARPSLRGFARLGATMVPPLARRLWVR